MLRIELLPDYIGDKNKIRNLGIMWGIGVIAVVFFLLAMNGRAGSANQAAKDDRAAKESLKATTDKSKSDIANEQKNRAQIESKQKFVLNSQLYNDGWPDVYETIRDVKPSDNSIILDSMALDGAKHQTVSLTGFGSDEKAIVRWWMSLRNNTALFDHVNFDLVPHSYAGANQAGSAGGPGMMGPGMGSSGGPGMMGMGNSGGSMSMSGKMGGPGAMGPGMMGPGGGGFGGGGRATAGNGPGELEGHSGINFTASVVLKTALAGGIPTPAWPAGSAPAGGGGGMMGPMGGGMGGSGGPSMGMGQMKAGA